MRFVIAVLLLLPIFTLPSAQSQAYTTVTTQTTLAHTMNYGSSTSKVSGPFNYMFPLVGAPGGNLYNPLVTVCPFSAFAFNATQDTPYSFSVTTNSSQMLFQVMSRSQYLTMSQSAPPAALASFRYSGEGARLCEWTNIPVHGGVGVTTSSTYISWPSLFEASILESSYTTIWTAPSDGIFYVVLTTGSSHATALYTLNIQGVAYVTQVMQITRSLTMGTSTPQPPPQSLQSVSFEELYAGLAAVFAILFVGTLTLLIRQRRTKRRR